MTPQTVPSLPTEIWWSEPGICCSAGPDGPVPVPESVIDCGEFATESAIITDATRGPVAWGEKVMEAVHDEAAARAPGQLVVSVKSAVFVPPIEMDEILSGAVPVFDNVITCWELFVPTT